MFFTLNLDIFIKIQDYLHCIVARHKVALEYGQSLLFFFKKKVLQYTICTCNTLKCYFMA